ncbi:hypothetical protein BKA93DRAFT_750444 [Sparassis latifolia]
MIREAASPDAHLKSIVRHVFSGENNTCPNGTTTRVRAISARTPERTYEEGYHTITVLGCTCATPPQHQPRILESGGRAQALGRGPPFHRMCNRPPLFVNQDSVPANVNRPCSGRRAELLMMRAHRTATGGALLWPAREADASIMDHDAVRPANSSPADSKNLKVVRCRGHWLAPHGQPRRISDGMWGSTGALQGVHRVHIVSASGHASAQYARSRTSQHKVCAPKSSQHGAVAEKRSAVDDVNIVVRASTGRRPIIKERVSTGAEPHKDAEPRTTTRITRAQNKMRDSEQISGNTIEDPRGARRIRCEILLLWTSTPAALHAHVRRHDDYAASEVSEECVRTPSSMHRKVIWTVCKCACQPLEKSMTNPIERRSDATAWKASAALLASRHRSQTGLTRGVKMEATPPISRHSPRAQNLTWDSNKARGTWGHMRHDREPVPSTRSRERSMQTHNSKLILSWERHRGLASRAAGEHEDTHAVHTQSRTCPAFTRLPSMAENLPRQQTVRLPARDRNENANMTTAIEKQTGTVNEDQQVRGSDAARGTRGGAGPSRNRPRLASMIRITAFLPFLEDKGNPNLA